MSAFTYTHLRNILRTAKRSFEVHVVAEAPERRCPSGRPTLILRHDVDLDLGAALRMADIERQLGVTATYMVMLDSPVYRLHQASTRGMLRELLSLGHEVALHFGLDDTLDRPGSADQATVEMRIRSAANRLEELISQPVRSVSFHRPLPQFVRGPLYIAGLANAYAAELMQWYLSDSRARWREGDPLPKLLNPDRSLLQLLIHPVWWGEEHRKGEDRLEEFYQSATRHLSPEQKQDFSEALAGHLTIQRSGLMKSTVEQDGTTRRF